MRHAWLVAIAVAYLYVFPHFPRIHSANELPRVYLVKAIVEDHSFAIDTGVKRWGGTADVSPGRDGHSYSNKAPGSSLLVVPIYALVRLVGEPSLGKTLWICRVVAGVIPALLFLLLLWRFLERYAPDEAVRRLVLIAYALGSLAMTYALLFYSHQLAAICIASAWIFAVDVAEGKGGTRAMIAAGLLAGAAPLVDYQAAFAGVPVAVYVLVAMRTRKRELVRALLVMMASAAIPIAILLWYHAVCFGSPLRTGYDASKTFAHFHQQGFLGMTRPHADAFVGSFIKPDNGLLVLSPWLLFAIPGGIVLWRRGERAVTIVAAAVALIFILFISSITFWRGGWGVGPRYVTAMLPFLLPLVAAALTALRDRTLLLGALCGTIVSSVVIYCASAATFPYWPDSLKNPLYEVTFRLIGDREAAPNAASLLFGLSAFASAIPFLLGVAALLGWALVRVVGVRGTLAAVGVGAVIIVAFAFAPRTGIEATRAYAWTLLPAVKGHDLSENERMALFADDMCRCKTARCAQDVSDHMIRWSKESPKPTPSEPVSDELLRLAKCHQRAMTEPY